MARAIEVKVSAQALERTLRNQLFSGPDGRYYIRGMQRPPVLCMRRIRHVSFKDDRVVVHVHTRAKLGTGLHGACLGVSLTTDADVSVVPDAEGESVGFRDARIERLSESRELNFLLVPFLSHKLPSQMKLNAADIMGKTAKPVGCVDRLHLDAGVAEDPFNAGRPRQPCRGCRCSYERRVRSRPI